MKYQEVERGHVVPAGYLRTFADGAFIQQHDVSSGRSRRRSVKSVGTRERPYSRTRPDGSRIDDVEWAIAQLEQRVEVLRQAAERFPLSEGDRSIIAQLAGLQHVRGPRWFQDHDDQLEEFIEDLGQRGLPGFSEVAKQIMAAPLRRSGEHLRDSTSRLILMQRSMYEATAIFFAMHWTLIQFDSPVLVTSDHPIVLWPAAQAVQSPAGARTSGLLDSLEVRYPLTSRLCLLMTWVDEPDALAVFPGKRHWARNLNAFTVANAEREWFHLPGAAPPLAADNARLLPISQELHPSYGPSDAASSRRRAAAERAARETRRQPLQKQMGFSAVTVNWKQ